MMPPGHVAVTLAAAEATSHKDVDYRWLAFSSVLPDLIDKPLAVLIFTKSHSSQNVTHALIPNLLLLFVTFFKWRQFLPYALAFNGHLLADRMWRHTETFWWPLFGWQRFWEYRFMNTPEAMVNVYLDIIRSHPRVWIVELIGLTFLGWFVLKHQLYRPAQLWPLLRTGRLVRPTEAG